MLKSLYSLGTVVILSTSSANRGDTARWKALAGDRFFDMDSSKLPSDDAEAVASVLSALQHLEIASDRNDPNTTRQ